MYHHCLCVNGRSDLRVSAINVHVNTALTVACLALAYTLSIPTVHEETLDAKQ